jgi:hypothetical protein
MTLADYFTAKFDLIQITLEFNPKWNSGMGDLNGAIDGAPAPLGLLTKTVTDDGRKVIMVGLDSVSIVVFQRYTDRDDIIVANFPSIINSLKQLKMSCVMDGAKSKEDLDCLIGSHCGGSLGRNIGHELLALWTFLETTSPLRKKSMR